MSWKRFKFSAVLLLACAVFAVTAFFSIDKSLHWLLEKDASSTGVDWVRHLERRIALSEEMETSDGKTAKTKTFQVDELVEIVSDILAVGNIYQIDFINTDCYCELSLGSYKDTLSGEGKTKHITVRDGHSFDDGHGHMHVPWFTKPSKGAVKHIFSDSKPHKPMSLNRDPNAREKQLPLDRARARSIINAAAGTQIFIHSNDIANEAAHQPKTFAEVYHPVLRGNDVYYMLRVLVNLEDRAARYAKVLYVGTGFILFLIIFAFGFPAVKFLYSLKKQRQADARSQYLANHDTLTGLANRNALQNNVPEMIGENATNPKECVLILLDVDSFKEINDYYGHSVGDTVLCKIAHTIREHFGLEAFVSRNGGDEFAVIVQGEDMDHENLSDTLASLINTFPLNHTFKIPNIARSIDVSLHAGYARYPLDGKTVRELMQHSNLALQCAKRSDKMKILAYEPDMKDRFTNRVTLFNDFRNALRESQIIPYYQPLVNMHTEHVEGFEALARWYHPTKGILSPAYFHDVLDDPEIGALVGSEMLHHTLSDMGKWQKAGVPFGSVGLNVCEADLLRSDFISDLVAGLAKHNLSKTSLAIEVTENCVYGKNTAILLDKIEQLRALGCYIALDDFGTGYSSITHIRNLPCTAVKIDKSFINKVVENGVDQAIVRALIDLGESIGFKVVAEGIETMEQLSLLRLLGCDLAQGYYFSKPVPASKVPALIALMQTNQDEQRLVANV